ncbi:MAG: hypothetical protein SLAVMIC_00955 [uncultured marine phage]|uniref:Uncharacterized protein n=1 Tax=uncultured marine phage TaxID=707152 RepID=A0A8D9CF37_9VIRU|nr:MAG: hypothetical protein SLAVMIC_00955 [uncultured marine phage]
MKIELTREDLIRLVKGTSPNSITECLKLTKEDKMRQIGNQHNYDWVWEGEYLQGLTERQLINLYKKYK